MAIKDTLKGFFYPGYIFPSVRVFYFFLFLLVTIAQTYCSLLMEEQLVDDDHKDVLKIS